MLAEHNESIATSLDGWIVVLCYGYSKPNVFRARALHLANECAHIRIRLLVCSDYDCIVHDACACCLQCRSRLFVCVFISFHFSFRLLFRHSHRTQNCQQQLRWERKFSWSHTYSKRMCRLLVEYSVHVCAKIVEYVKGITRYPLQYVHWWSFRMNIASFFSIFLSLFVVYMNRVWATTASLTHNHKAHGFVKIGYMFSSMKHTELH